MDYDSERCSETLEEEEDIFQGETNDPTYQNISTDETSQVNSSMRPRKLPNESHERAKRKYVFKHRKPNPRGQSKLREGWDKRVETMSAEDLSSIFCCKKLNCFQKANKRFLVEKIKLFLTMSAINRRQTLSSMYGSSGKFYFDGNPVCTTFLLKAFHFSRDLQSSVRSIASSYLTLPSNEPHVQQGVQQANVVTNPGSASIFAAPGKEAIITFMNRLSEDTGDRMPDSDEMHLPFHQKEEVYIQFKEDFVRSRSDLGVEPPTKSYFFKVWKAHCRHIKIRKNNRFAKCEICERLKDEMRRAVTTFNSTSSLLAQKRAHYKMVSDERLEYKRKRDIAIHKPEQAWSVIVDGADQTAFGLPHFISKTKGQKGESLKVKLVGLLEHAVENKLFLLTMTEEHKTGANHIVEAVHRFLMNRSLSNPPPPKLFMQVDNCIRENKNRFFLSYAECLVRWSVFQEVEVSFLPVGHTHEDIDQAFSTTSSRLKGKDAITLSDLHNELRNVYNKHTTVAHMRYIVNWSGLCEREKVLTTVKNFSKYRYFSFRRLRGSGNELTQPSISCMVKVNIHDDWEPLKPLFLVSVPDLINTPPTVISFSADSRLGKAKSEFNKRLESEEERIRIPQKVGELKQLRDHIFRSRSERFHWNVSSCIELRHKRSLEGQSSSDSKVNNCTVKDYNSASRGRKTDTTDNAGSPSESIFKVDEINHNDTNDEEVDANFSTVEIEVDTIKNLHTGGYNYERGSFIAVLSETADQLPSFWVGKVINAEPDVNGIVPNLTVQWYEAYSRSDKTVNKFSDKYAPSYLERGTSRERPWTNSIEATAVLINFSSLLKDRRLPCSVQKHLRVVLPTFKK